MGGTKDEITKPFLRWAGGKTWLIKHLRDLLPKADFANYHEPFLGGGSIFLSSNLPNRAFLSDLNEDLIKVYDTLRENPEEIIHELKKYKNDSESYYRIRNEKPEDSIQLAARFIYLNQTSFNGIYRVNLNGEYNVPFGNRTKDFLQAEQLRKVSAKLKNAEIFCADFDKTRENIRKGDLVFLDPPYTVSHNNNGFIKYNQHLFSIEDQHRLSAFIDHLRKERVFYILTNAAHETIKNIFEKGDRRLELNRASLIGGTKAVRGSVNEYLFTNIGL